MRLSEHVKQGEGTGWHGTLWPGSEYKYCISPALSGALEDLFRRAREHIDLKAPRGTKNFVW